MLHVLGVGRLPIPQHLCSILGVGRLPIPQHLCSILGVGRLPIPQHLCSILGVGRLPIPQHLCSKVGAMGIQQSRNGLVPWWILPEIQRQWAGHGRGRDGESWGCHCHHIQLPTR